MDHSDEDTTKDIAIRTSLSEEETIIPLVPSFSDTFRLSNDDELSLEGCNYQVDLEQLRAFCLAPNGLVSPEWRKLGWPKLVGAHVEIWKTAAKLTPVDNNNSNDKDDDEVTSTSSSTTITTNRLHHPSRDEIEYIKQVVASCDWESVGILKEDSIVLPERNKQQQQQRSISPQQQKQDRRVSFHLPELAFSTKRQKDRKTLRKVLIHLKRTNPDFAITSATCSAVAMVLAIVHSSSLSTLVVQQLVSFPWKYSREWPRSNNAWELDDRWQSLFMLLLSNDLLQHWESNGMYMLEGTIRYSWIPSWLSQNIPNKDFLARIWDVLIPSKPDAILYVCLSLLSHFEKEFLSVTNANNLRSVLLELPTKLDSMEKVEAVLSQAMEWMKVHHHDQHHQNDEIMEAEMMIPSWATATVAPDDYGIVEYARHLRETVTKEGKSLISKTNNNNGSDGMDDNTASAWFSLEASDSRFVAALKARSLNKKKEDKAAPASNKSSWVPVLFILILAVAVIVGLETDCSVLLGAKKPNTTTTTTTKKSNTNNNCLHQISDLMYREDAMNQVSQLFKVMSELKPTTTTTTDASTNGTTKGGVAMESSNNSDAVLSPSENMDGGEDHQEVQEELGEETIMDDTPPPQLDLEEEGEEHTIDPEKFDRLESSMEESEDNTWPDHPEPEVPEPSPKESDGVGESDKEEDASEESDDPVERSQQAAERLVEESLHQTKAASKLAEDIVSQFAEEAKAALDKVEGTTEQEFPEMGLGHVEEEMASESNDGRQTEASKDADSESEPNEADNGVSSSPESYTSDSHEIEMQEDYPSTEEKIEEMTTYEMKLKETEGEGHEKSNVVPLEQDTSSDQVTEVLNDDDHETLSVPIEDPGNTGDIVVGADEALEEEVNEMPAVPPEQHKASNQVPEAFNDGDRQALSDPIEDPVTKGDTVGTEAQEDESNEMTAPPEQETASDQVPKALNDDDHQTYKIEDPINAGDIVGADEALEDEVDETLPKETLSIEQVDLHTVQPPSENEEIETETPEQDEREHIIEDKGEVSKDHQHLCDEEPNPGLPHVGRYFADESLNESTSDESNSNEKAVESDDEALRDEPTEQNGGGGPTVLEMAHGFFSRYLGYFSSDPHLKTIHLSTPFFSKDDVTVVFEQLMAASIDEVPTHNWYKKSKLRLSTYEVPVHNWYKKSKIRFSTWESTILI